MTSWRLCFIALRRVLVPRCASSVPRPTMESVCWDACDASASCVASCIAENGPKEVRAQDVLGAFGLLVLSALFSGLTLGLMSLDPQQLELAIAGDDEERRRQALHILPLRKRGNLLLCTLLLGNTFVNAGIAILTASFTNGLIGGFVSTAFILCFGEIIPQSFCSRNGLAAGAKTVDIVRIFIVLLFPVAWPMSKVLDRVLGEELGTVYSRRELKELFAKQAKQAEAQAAGESGAAGGESAGGESGTIGLTEATFMCGVLSLSERSAEQIMTRMHDVLGLYTHEKFDFPLMSRVYASGFTRIPILRHNAHLAAAQAANERKPPSRSQSDSDLPHGTEPPPAGAHGGADGADEPSAPGDGGGGATAAVPAAATECELLEAAAASEPSATGGLSGVVVADGSAAALGGEPTEVVGLLSAKDLILVDPEDALSVEQLLAHCGREVRRAAPHARAACHRPASAPHGHARSAAWAAPPVRGGPTRTAHRGARATGDARLARHARQHALQGLYPRQLAPRFRVPAALHRGGAGARECRRRRQRGGQRCGGRCRGGRRGHWERTQHRGAPSLLRAACEAIRPHERSRQRRRRDDEQHARRRPPARER